MPGEWRSSIAPLHSPEPLPHMLFVAAMDMAARELKILQGNETVVPSRHAAGHFAVTRIGAPLSLTKNTGWPLVERKGRS
jgi:hypothetical protein